MKTGASARLGILAAFVFFGTISIPVRYVTVPTGMLAMCRAFVGGGVLLLYMAVRHQRFDFAAAKTDLRWLLGCGVMMGFNWILFFESYKYTTVTVTTLCYYMAPTLIILGSARILQERLTTRKLLCAAAALLGMVFISGIVDAGMPSAGEARGILFGLLAAVLYASIILCNKRMTATGAIDRTAAELLLAGVMLVFYNLLTGDIAFSDWSARNLLFTVLLGAVWTGSAYALYFLNLLRIPAQTAALMSYTDPVVAMLVSVFFFREPISLTAGIGAVLILGAAVVSELPGRKKTTTSA